MSLHSIQRREEILRLAEDLAMRLRTARVPYLNDPSEHAAGGGVSASTLAHADAYLARVRELDAFREFLSHFDELDRMTAQNVDNPKAEHRIARQEVEALLEAHRGLTVDELLYLLAWSRRLLPKQAGRAGPRRRPKGDTASGKRGDPAREGRRGGSTTFKGGQLAQALERLRGNEDRGEE